jgi:hypothetical protein
VQNILKYFPESPITGEWTAEESVMYPLGKDRGLVLQTADAKAAIYAYFDSPANISDHDTFIIQYYFRGF